MLNELYEAVKETQLPCAYSFFREIPEPPYLIFEFTYSNNFDADDKVYLKRDRYAVSLFTAKKDPATETLVESKLEKYEFLWDKTESYIESEELYQITYTIFER